jgi:hypothetical protein
VSGIREQEPSARREIGEDLDGLVDEYEVDHVPR